MRTLVLVRIPPGARLEDDPDGPLLPLGAEAVRLEISVDPSAIGDDSPPPSSRVLDARGTIFEGKGERFYVLRRSADGLEGPTWMRGDLAAQSEATRALAAAVESGRLSMQRGADDRTREAGRLASRNDCAACHEHGRAERARAVVHRGSDGRGLFGLRSALADRDPFESYRPRNANLEDPYVRVECGAGEAPCFGVYDLARALAERAPHARAVCRTRTYLAGAMTEPARRRYASALAPCRVE